MFFDEKQYILSGYRQAFFQNDFILKKEIVYQKNASYNATSKLFAFAKYNKTSFL